jgi:3,4-dihydroxy 2-butanone 4-phosphate synthase / GTP cyclohydrolase II
MNEDGTMARVPDLIEFCKTHSLKMVTVADLIRYRMHNERYIHRVAESQLPTTHGEFRMVVYESDVHAANCDAADGESHIALVYGDLDFTHPPVSHDPDEPVLVRVQTHCLAGNVFGSALCDCHATLDASLRQIAAAGRGALVYLHHTQRGFGIERSLTAGIPGIPGRLTFHRSGPERSDRTNERPSHSQRVLRAVGLGGQILSDLGLRKIRLLSNHPTHVPALQGFGIEIVERVPIELDTNVARVHER